VARYSSLSARGAVASPGSQPEVVSAFWKGIDVFRPLALAYAAYSLWDRPHDLARPTLAWAVLGVLGVWTVFLVFYRRRRLWLVVVELLLAAGAILATLLVDTAESIEAGSRTLPTFWPAAGVVSAAVLLGRKGGIPAAVFIGIVDVVEVRNATPNTINNIVLLLLIGALIGYACDLAREGHAKLREAIALEAQVRERERLARTVHDGVLQTLAFINRRGTQLGGESSQLAAMAADQERQLRALVSGTSAEAEATVSGEVDLRQQLRRYAGGQVHLVAPGDPVLVPPRVAAELAAAVGAALDNVRQHAGEAAQAWVLVEDEGRDVALTVRDNGVGMPAGRLEEAAAAGRLGASSSIRGRLADLGGTAEFTARDGAGVTVRMRAPKHGGRDDHAGRDDGGPR
jgi:signal transduction histidine kinase